MANHYSVDQWRVWILEFEQSGLTVAQFCKSIEASVPTFYKWRRKLNNNGSTTRVVEPPAPEFVSINLASSQLEIELPGGAIARVANDANSIRPRASDASD